MEEEVASKDLGLAIIGTRRKLTRICPYVFRGEVGISIVNLITLEIEVVILCSLKYLVTAGNNF
jgi:hypothetical protein